RFNIWHFKNVEVMIDYAHNTGGFIELEKFMNKTRATTKVGIIAAVGDRRDEDIMNVGRYAARMFDSLIIRHDADTRGRNVDEIDHLLTLGAREVNENIPIDIIPVELEAVAHAMENAPEGSFICLCAENIAATIEYLDRTREAESVVNLKSKFILSKAS
ncbi:MAG: cyanophycin synthetase, partial [Bacteroidota bacterium]